MLYTFGDHYTLDPTCYELRQHGVLVHLEPRVFAFLTYLVQHPNRTVTKEELIEQLWPQQFVADDSLTNCVAQARKALSDTGQTQRYIQTIRRRGYRFVARIAVQPQGETTAKSPPPPDPLMPTEPHGFDPPRAAGRSIPEAERRQLTVLSCRVIGAPPRSAPLDPEVLLDVVRDYQAMYVEIVHRFAGHLVQEQGDRLVVYFGYPRAHEDDARRAVHTGLGLVERMGELNRRLTRDRGVRLAVRVGIHTGVVVVGARGHARRELLTLGDTPTIAAQIQGLAAPDAVIISAATRRLVADSFDVQALGASLLEDATEPLALYQILQERTAPGRFAVTVTKTLTPLVGREQEVGLLHERWAQVQEGLGQVVLLSGEAGIGKSRLVQTLTEYLEGEVHTRIDYYCSPYHQQSACYPLVHHLQRLLRFRPDDPPEAKVRRLEEACKRYNFSLEEVVPLLAVFLSLPPPAHYPPLTLTPQRQKQKTLEALLVWLLAEAERQPVCVVIEDLHWVDPSTLEFLSLLIKQVPTTRLLLVLVFRPDFHPPWALRSYVTPLALGRLSRRQVATMAEKVTGGKALPAEVLRHVVTKADGVPLFVEELTKMILESGLVKEWEEQYALTGPLPALAIPATLHDALMARLDQWEAAKPVAQLGAVMGREFTYEVLQAVAPMEEATLQQGLAQLVEAELLYQRGLPPQATYRFKHALIQDAAYQSLLRSTRQQYHQRIAQVLEVRFPEIVETQPELLAHHYAEAGCQAQALPYWQRAGQRAMHRSAYVEAVSHLTRGLELLTTLPDMIERRRQELDVQLTLGQALAATKGLAAPERGHALTRARALCQQVGEMPQLLPVLDSLVTFYLNRGEFQTARELGEQALTLAQGLQDLAGLGHAHITLGNVLCFFGEWDAARPHLEQGLALYKPQQHRTEGFFKHFNTAHQGVFGLSRLAQVLWCLGYPDQALQWSQEALTLARELAHPASLTVALVFAAEIHQSRREGQSTYEHAEAALVLACEHGFAYRLAQATILRGWALVEQGQGEAGLTQIRLGLAAERATGAENSRSYRLLTEAYGNVGQTEEGLRIVAEALARSTRSGEGWGAAELYRRKGELLLTRSAEDHAEAETCFQQTLAIARRQQAKSWELRAATSLAHLWQRQGKRTEARELLALVYGWFTEGFDTADLHEAKALLDALA
jgi:class 3 adenylate cyclase/predicted ATPase